MSNDDVLSRKDLKAPDKFQVVATRAVDWVVGHKKHARAAAIAVAAAVVLAVVAWVAGASRATKAGELTYEVIRAAGAEVSAVPLPGVPGPFFATDAERQRAVVAAADRTLAEYPSTAAGRLALLLKGDGHLRLGETEAAVSAYEKYLAGTPAEEPLRFGALEGIALAREAQGKLDDAVAAWDRAGREASLVSDFADLQRARVLGAAGKAEEARKLLEGFADRHKGSTLTADASDALARLGAK